MVFYPFRTTTYSLVVSGTDGRTDRETSDKGRLTATESPNSRRRLVRTESVLMRPSIHLRSSAWKRTGCVR
jgi:hypothetical protein